MPLPENIRKKDARHSAFISAIFSLLTVIIYLAFYSGCPSLFPVCPFSGMTHLYCPGCGVQRCFVSLLHGHVGQSLHQNALAVMAVPVLAYRWLLFFRREGIAGTFFANKRFVWYVLAAMLVFAVLRNIPVSPFCGLAPR